MQWFVCCIVLVSPCPLVSSGVVGFYLRDDTTFHHYIGLEGVNPRTETMNNSNRPSVRLGRRFRALPLSCAPISKESWQSKCAQLWE